MSSSPFPSPDATLPLPGPLPWAEADADINSLPPVMAEALVSARPELLALQASKSFSLGQNFPDPFQGVTTIPFVLGVAASVRLHLFDPLGRKVAAVGHRNLAAGPQQIELNLHGLGLLTGAYTYELQVTNRYGTFRQQRGMTAAP